MLRRFAQLLRSSEIGRFSGVASSDSETQNDQKCEKSWKLSKKLNNPKILKNTNSNFEI